MKFQASTSATHYFKPKELAEAHTMFSILRVVRTHKPSYQDKTKQEEVLQFKLRLSDGREGVVELFPTQAREKVFEQVEQCVANNDILEDVYFVLDSYEKTPAKYSPKGKLMREAEMQSYIRFSDIDQATFDAIRAAELDSEDDEDQDEHPF